MGMTDGWTASLTHEHLRRMDGKLDRLLDDMHEMKVHVSRLEENYAGVSRRLDRIERDVDCIKKRLGPRGGLRPYAAFACVSLRGGWNKAEYLSPAGQNRIVAAVLDRVEA